jgi:hypothetical protein
MRLRLDLRQHRMKYSVVRLDFGPGLLSTVVIFRAVGVLDYDMPFV